MRFHPSLARRASMRQQAFTTKRLRAAEETIPQRPFLVGIREVGSYRAVSHQPSHGPVDLRSTGTASHGVTRTAQLGLGRTAWHRPNRAREARTAYLFAFFLARFLAAFFLATFLVAFFAAFFLGTFMPPSKGSRRVLLRFFKTLEGHPQVLALNKRTSYRPSNLLRQSFLSLPSERSACVIARPRCNYLYWVWKKIQEPIEHFS